MRDAHAHLVAKGLNETHFDAVMKHSLATLQELGVSEELIAEAKKIAESSRKDVLGQLWDGNTGQKMCVTHHCNGQGCRCGRRILRGCEKGDASVFYYLRSFIASIQFA